MRADDLVPPQTFPAAWLVVAVACLAVLGAWGAVAASTYYRGIAAPAGEDAPRPHARQLLHAELCRLEAKALDGAIGPRAGAQELVLLVRALARIVTGIDARHLTLEEMRGHARLAPAADLIERLYAKEFARDEDAGIERELREAKRLAERWR